MLVELDGERYLAMRTDRQDHPVRVESALVLGAPTVEQALRLARKLTCAREALRREHPRVFGTPSVLGSFPEVDEEDVILAPALYRDLLQCLDGFRRSVSLCADLRIAPNRGVLLVGRPGTGKTMLIRHLMTRFSDLRRFLFVNDPSMRSGENLEFRSLVRELGTTEQPTLVIIEDIDHLFDSGTVSQELFLNVLDGLLEPRAPTLWIGTSNDPSGMEDNLLDRPGRFDRVFVIPLPGLDERTRLVERYSGESIGDTSVRSVASRTEGLSPAHIREICVAGSLAAAENGAPYSEHLERELVRVRGQHQQSRRYHAAVAREFPSGNSERQVGQGVTAHPVVAVVVRNS